MKCIDRYEEYKDESLDQIMLWIRSGKIKSGKYSHLIKIDKNKMNGRKEFFTDGNSKSK